jgi:hypothetical protein
VILSPLSGVNVVADLAEEVGQSWPSLFLTESVAEN